MYRIVRRAMACALTLFTNLRCLKLLPQPYGPENGSEGFQVQLESCVGDENPRKQILSIQALKGAASSPTISACISLFKSIWLFVFLDLL